MMVSLIRGQLFESVLCFNTIGMIMNEIQSYFLLSMLSVGMIGYLIWKGRTP